MNKSANAGSNHKSLSRLIASTKSLFTERSTSAPSQLSNVFVEDSQTTGAAVIIFWNLLSCLQQNGANITGYIIQYSPTSGGDLAARNLSAFESFDVICSHTGDSRYSCLLSRTLFLSVRYSFQVAAINGYGVGRFSVPVYATIHTQGND